MIAYIPFIGAAPPPPGSLARDMLRAHNAVRSRIGLSVLVWSESLAARAQDRAKTLLKTGKFEHTPNSAYGENLFEIRGAAATPSEVVSDWASESRNYDYTNNTCRGVCGHYTQIVWGETKKVGCGVAAGGGRQVWVCQYDPPGNVIDRRPY